MIEKGEKISKELNNYLSVFTQEEPDGELELEQIFRGQEADKLNDICIGREMVRKDIDKLKKTKSPGPDDIFPRILKECREQLDEPVTRIFRNSLDTGIVPRLWR